MTEEKRQRREKFKISLFNQRTPRTLMVVLTGPRQVSVQQELNPFIKTISSVAICPVCIKCVTRNLNLLKIVAPGGSCYLWASLMVWVCRWELWGQNGHGACSIHPYFHAFTFLPLRPFIPVCLYPFIHPGFPKVAREERVTRLGWACPSVVTWCGNTPFFSPIRYFSH